MSTIDIPFIHCLLKPEYISETHKDPIEAFVFAVTCIPSRPLLFHAHLINGAVYSRLPVWAFTTDKNYIKCNKRDRNDFLSPWGALGASISCKEHIYLKGYHPEVIRPITAMSRYIATFHFTDGYYSEIPEQEKCLHLVNLDSGCFGLYPNNFLSFKDMHFTKDKEIMLSRNETFYNSP